MTPLRLFASATLALALAVPVTPVFAAMPATPGTFADLAVDGAGALVIDVKQGRSGTGLRGRDRNDDSRGGGKSDDSAGSGGSGRTKVRIPGGSGCDSPADLLEHPECLLGGAGTKTGKPGEDMSGSGRDKVRIPGGSGCDDPRDLIEHPECRL